MTVPLNISEKDYVFINDKVNRYRKLKEGIRKRIRSWLTGCEKSWLSEDKKNGVDKFVKNLSNSVMHKWRKRIAVNA